MSRRYANVRLSNISLFKKESLLPMYRLTLFIHSVCLFNSPRLRLSWFFFHVRASKIPWKPVDFSVHITITSFYFYFQMIEKDEQMEESEKILIRVHPIVEKKKKGSKWLTGQ